MTTRIRHYLLYPAIRFLSKYLPFLRPHTEPQKFIWPNSADYWEIQSDESIAVASWCDPLAKAEQDKRQVLYQARAKSGLDPWTGEPSDTAHRWVAGGPR